MKTANLIVAMHAAGVTLMRPDPRLVAAAFGILSPVIVGAAMALSSVSVVANTLLLKRWKPRN